LRVGAPEVSFTEQSNDLRTVLQLRLLLLPDPEHGPAEACAQLAQTLSVSLGP